jgi:hypothetical protein
MTSTDTAAPALPETAANVSDDQLDTVAPAVTDTTADAPQEELRIIHMPETPEHLRLFIISTVNQMLQDPRNASVFAAIAVNGMAASLKNDQQRLERDMLRPVLVKQYFPNSIRATVSTPVTEEEHSQQLTVVLETLSATGNWEPLNAVQQKQDILIRLVLTRVTAPGEVWFITTSRDIEELASQGADILAAANGM